MKKFMILGSFTLALATVGGYTYLSSQELVATPSFQSMLFPVGTHSYRIDLKSSGSIDTQNIARSFEPTATPSSSQNHMNSHVTGELSVTSSEGKLQFLLTPEIVRIGTQDLTSEDLGLNPSPVTITLNNQGQFTAIQLPVQNSAMANSLWMTLLAELQTTHSETDKSAWTVEEKDHMAVYKTSYSKEPSRLVKVRDEILESSIAGLSGTKALQLNPRAEWIAKLSGNKLVELKTLSGMSLLQNGQLSYQAENALHLVHAHSSKDHKLHANNTSRHFAYNNKLLSEVTKAETERSRYTEDLDGITLDEIHEKIGQEMSEDEETEFYKKVRAYLYLNPASARDFAEKMIDGRYDGPELRVIAVALGKLGHKEAQATLRDVISARLQRGELIANYVHLLAQGSEPTVETMNLLKDLTRSKNPEAKEAGYLALGTALGQREASDPKGTYAQLHEILYEYTVTRDKEVRAYTIDLIGNSKLSVALPTLKAELQKPLPRDERSLVIEALRQIDEPSARQILVKLSESQDQADALAAVKASKYQTFMPELLERSEKALRDESDQSLPIKGAYLEWLYQHQASIPDLAKRLEAYLTRETDETLRRNARSMLDVLKLSTRA